MDGLSPRVRGKGRQVRPVLLCVAAMRRRAALGGGQRPLRRQQGLQLVQEDRYVIERLGDVLRQVLVLVEVAVNPEVKSNALRAAGDIKFDQYAEVPIIWLPSQIAINPEEVGEFVWPGNINTSFTHTEYVTVAQ